MSWLSLLFLRFESIFVNMSVLSMLFGKFSETPILCMCNFHPLKCLFHWDEGLSRTSYFHSGNLYFHMNAYLLQSAPFYPKAELLLIFLFPYLSHFVTCIRLLTS